MNGEIKKRHEQDALDAAKVEEIVGKILLDLPSLERQIWHSDSEGDEPFLSDGYLWRDKPGKAMQTAIDEIRMLRKRLLELERR